MPNSAWAGRGLLRDVKPARLHVDAPQIGRRRYHVALRTELLRALQQRQEIVVSRFRIPKLSHLTSRRELNGEGIIERTKKEPIIVLDKDESRLIDVSLNEFTGD